MKFYKPTLKRKDMDSVLQAMVDEQIGPGDKCQYLAQQFAQQVSCTNAVAFRTYHDCIRTALILAGAKQGTTVALSPLAPYVYKEVLSSMECSVVWVDADRENGLPDEQQVVQSNPEILILYENCGSLPLKYDNQTTFAKKCDYGDVLIIEDVTQSLGAGYRDEYKAGDWGKIVICAMEDDNLVSAAGGAVLAARGDIVYSLRSHRPDSFRRMTDLNASLASVQIENLNENNIKRREIVKVYEQSLSKTKHKKFGLTLFDFESPCAGFDVFLDCKPEEVIKFAQKREVPVKLTFEHCSAKDIEGDLFSLFPICAAYYYRTVSFPVYPFLKNNEIDEINKIIAHLP